MSTEPTPQTPAQQLIGETAPKLVELTDQVLFGDVWERPELSPRDRSLITAVGTAAGFRDLLWPETGVPQAAHPTPRRPPA